MVAESVKKISLFDLDRTLLSVNCSFYFGAHLYLQGFFKTPVMIKLLTYYSLQKLGLISLKKLHLKCFQLIFFNKKADFISQLSKPFASKLIKKFSYTPAIKRLQKAKKEGHYIAILSNSPDFIVASMAQLLGVNDFQGTSYETDENGHFSKVGRLVEGVDKASYLKETREKFQLAKESAIAYSDSFLDRPFLEEAGVAVAVNPDSRLKSLASRNGWEII